MGSDYFFEDWWAENGTTIKHEPDVIRALCNEAYMEGYKDGAEMQKRLRAVPTHAGNYTSICMICKRQMENADKRCSLCTDCTQSTSDGDSLSRGPPPKPESKLGRKGAVGA